MNLFGRKSVTFRLTLLFASVSTAVLLLLALLVSTLAEQHFEELDMELLNGKLELIQHALENVRSPQDLDALPKRLKESLIGHRGLDVVALTHDGRTLFSTEGAKFPDGLRDNDGSRPIVWTDKESHTYRSISRKVLTGMNGVSPIHIAVSTNLSHHERFMHSFQLALWLVVGLATLLTGFLGWLAAHRGLAPLREILEKASDITANRLDHRISVAAIPVELAEVADTLNAMLARLEESFKRLSDFSSDIAHELRTPVSNLLTQTQVILSRDRTADEYKNVLASNAEELERLSRAIADMLFLAKSDNDLIVPHREKVDLLAEVQGLFEFYDIVAEEKNIQLTYSGNGIVSGDRLMLRRAISNLLSNAVRHTSVGGQVAVSIQAQEDSSVTLTVRNSGAGIAAEHLPRLFDRFYRVDPSRQNFGEGVGLGLAITRSIAKAHGGDVSVESESGITTFGLRKLSEWQGQ